MDEPTKLSLFTAEEYLSLVLRDGKLTVSFEEAKRRLAILLDAIAIGVLEGAVKGLRK